MWCFFCVCGVLCVLFFFFSSRRRHTRLQGDWSSDVCSSDLQLTLAPYVAAGWVDRPVADTPWRATPGARVTLGLGIEWLGVFRIEAGVGAQSRRAGFAFDVTRDFWGIL